MNGDRSPSQIDSVNATTKLSFNLIKCLPNISIVNNIMCYSISLYKTFVFSLLFTYIKMEPTSCLNFLIPVNNLLYVWTVILL